MTRSAGVRPSFLFAPGGTTAFPAPKPFPGRRRGTPPLRLMRATALIAAAASTPEARSSKKAEIRRARSALQPVAMKNPRSGGPRSASERGCGNRVHPISYS